MVSLQYCYQATNNNIDNNRTIIVFAFLSLTQNGMNFTVNKQIFIRTTPSKSICTVCSGSIQQICCDNTTLRTTDQFQLPSSNFSFGVAIRNQNVRPLAITTSSTRMEYHVEQYVTLVRLNNPPGTMFTLASNEKVNDHTLLFRFSIGNYYVIIIIIIIILIILIIIIIIVIMYFAGSGNGSIPPIIPDFYFNDSNAAANFRTDDSANLTQSQFRRVAYIFTIPPESSLRNCSGTVVSLQYCYQARNRDIERNRPVNVFIFLSLTQNGMRFTVNRQMFIRTTPANTICTNSSGSIEQICCDTTTLNTNNQLQLSSSNFSFGVVITNGNVRPLAFTTSSTEYHVKQYRTSLGNSETMFTLSSNEKVNDSFLLFRFVIGKEIK